MSHVFVQDLDTKLFLGEGLRLVERSEASLVAAESAASLAMLKYGFNWQARSVAVEPTRSEILSIWGRKGGKNTTKKKIRSNARNGSWQRPGSRKGRRKKKV